jgi:hypothetical protein
MLPYATALTLVIGSLVGDPVDYGPIAFYHAVPKEVSGMIAVVVDRARDGVQVPTFLRLRSAPQCDPCAHVQ